MRATPKSKENLGLHGVSPHTDRTIHGYKARSKVDRIIPRTARCPSEGSEFHLTTSIFFPTVERDQFSHPFNPYETTLPILQDARCSSYRYAAITFSGSEFARWIGGLLEFRRRQWEYRK